MKRYWLFYGWYDDYDCPGANGGLSDFHGSFDSIEGAYVDFAMAKNYYNEPACWCQILDSETSEIVKLQGFGETDRDLTHLRKHFKCPEIETQSPGAVSEWIDAEIYQSEIRAQKDDVPGEWVKIDGFGLLHNYSLCSNSECECHTVESKRVATPFPIEAGNPYCCNKCALQPGIGGTRGDLIGLMDDVPGTFAIVAPNDQKEVIPDDCACPSCGQNLHTKAYVYNGLFGSARQTICVDCSLKLISWFHPKRGYIWISDIKAMEGIFIPANGQKPIRSKFDIKNFIAGLFNKYL